MPSDLNNPDRGCAFVRELPEPRPGLVDLEARQKDFKLVVPGRNAQPPQDALVIEHLVLDHDIGRLAHAVGQQQAAAVRGVATPHRNPGQPGKEGGLKGVLQQKVNGFITPLTLKPLACAAMSE